MYTHNGRTIEVGKSWVSDNGFTHPKNWQQVWGDADLERWSVVYSADPVKKTWDSRFYWGYKVDSDGKETDELNPKALADVEEKDADGNNKKDKDGNNIITLGLKSVWIAKKKAEANDLLSKTDWYVTRKQEKDTAIPNLITLERNAIRTACAGIETKINSCDTLDKFIALFSTSEDGDGNVVKSDMDCY